MSAPTISEMAHRIWSHFRLDEESPTIDSIQSRPWGWDDDDDCGTCSYAQGCAAAVALDIPPTLAAQMDDGDYSIDFLSRPTDDITRKILAHIGEELPDHYIQFLLEAQRLHDNAASTVWMPSWTGGVALAYSTYSEFRDFIYDNLEH